MRVPSRDFDDFNVLLICDDHEKCAEYADKEPESVFICYSLTDKVSIEMALKECCPHAIFIIFGKGEHATLKKYPEVMAFVENNSAYFGVMGSKLQLATMRRLYGEDLLTVSSPRMLREAIVALRDRRKRHYLAMRRHFASRAKGEPPTIAIIGKDIQTWMFCEFAIQSYARVNDIEFITAYADIEVDVREFFDETDTVPEILIFSDKDCEAKYLNAICMSVEYKKIPYILFSDEEGQTSVKPLKRRPAAIINIASKQCTLGFRIDEILHRRG